MMKKLIAIILAGMMLVTLFGCGEQETVSVSSTKQTANNTPQTTKVTFSAKSGAQDLVLDATTGDVYDWNDFDDVMITQKSPVKVDEFKDKEVVYKIDGVERKYIYMDSNLYPDGSAAHWYKSGKNYAIFNTNDEFCGFYNFDEGFEYKYRAETKEQREQLAKQAVTEYFNIDTTEWIYIESKPVNGDITGYLNYYLDGKKILEQVTAVFDDNGLLKGCLLQRTGVIRNISDYPNFDRDECYEVAKEKLFEKLNSYNRFVGYGNIDKQEMYWMIGNKVYYKFRFAIDQSAVEGNEHQFLSENDEFSDIYDCTVDIYVELITE